MKLQTLYQRGKKGEVRIWRTWTEGSTVWSEAGVQDGKLTQSSYVCVPKNVGRANATTAEQQAEAEARAEWEKKLSRKYHKSVPPAGTQNTNMPMLAERFFVKGKPGVLTTHAKKIKWPVDVQVKFDGVRAKARRVDGKVVLFPRSGQLDEVYDAKHVIQQLESWLPEDMELDGELYVHGKKLQEIASLATRFRPESTSLVYNVYDVPMLGGCRDAPWLDRRDHLVQIIETPSVKRVKTIQANGVDDVVGYFRRFRERGFEGAMVRLHSFFYECGFRSTGLLKVKEHETAEFEVIGCKEGVGKDVGTATFKCLTNEKRREDRKEFDARMRGTLPERQQFWNDRALYIGRKLTVSFMRWTEAGKPQEPVGEVFRDKRDLG